MNQTGNPSYELAVESGPRNGARFALDQPLMSIGRSPDNNIVLEDSMVSKSHARIIVQGNNYLIEDLGSSNGTIVNGQRISSHILAEGDRLYLGETNVVFRSAAALTAPMPAVGTVAPPAMAGVQGVMPPVPAVPARAGGSKKGIFITLGVVGGLAVIAGATLLLVFLLAGEKDNMKPQVKFTSPAAGLQLQLALPAGTPAGVDVGITASDDKGLDRVELLVDDKVVKTFKATTATREAKAEDGRKEETFTYKWSSATPGNHNFRAKAYDWKGNAAETDPVALAVSNGPEIAQAHAYCQQIDGLITEFVQFRQKFNQAYEAAKRGNVSYVEAGYVFDQVGNERRSLKGRLASIPPPPSFAPSHALFDQQIDYAIQADNFAVLWARDMQLNMPYYDAGQISDPDPNGYEDMMQNASAATQQAGAAFRAAYNGERASQLKIGPGPDPNG